MGPGSEGPDSFSTVHTGVFFFFFFFVYFTKAHLFSATAPLPSPLAQDSLVGDKGFFSF